MNKLFKKHKKVIITLVLVVILVAFFQLFKWYVTRVPDNVIPYY